MNDLVATMKELAAHVPAVLYVFQIGADAKARLLYANEAAIPYWGEWDPDKAQPADAGSIGESFHESERAGFVAEFTRAMSTDTDLRWMGRMKDTSGNWRWVRFHSRIRREPDGSMTWYGVMTDAQPEQQAIEAREASEAAKTDLIQRLRMAIDELSTPILEVADEVLAVPIIGVVDSQRAAQVIEKLLHTLVEKQCRTVILDVTGVDVIDTRTADHFLRLIKAVELMGAQCLLSGMRPPVAQALVDLGIDLGAVRTSRNLKHALRESVRGEASRGEKGSRGAMLRALAERARANGSYDGGAQ
jgi:anti-anti-sigma regulatory factor